ncbi:breast carcinoma amplified sequence 2 [Linderina pennispora]|uniref:Breast carcinoma amplified sequence 2 n=1 Tax=Linderina pennispora TaxID=61395 RepID=A0A1Y1VX61_9FUNG|nr:breast carcinoma amplified sequence 2 [Linderina pennispora]ORX65605.1 breast carcinoma amplified sequence 2 [Linderina pennispora]
MDSHSAAIDSLPYIDKEYDDPSMRDQVSSLIQKEMGRMSPPLLPKSTTLFKNNDLLRKEYERVRAGKPLPEFDIERYKLEAPEDSDNVGIWRSAADNAAAQLEHQNIRLVNLELLQQFGANAWKLSNYQKEGLLRNIEKATDRHRDEGVNVNKARKYEQTEAGIKLRDIEERWTEGVKKCIDIQVASSELKGEIAQLEAELARRSQ